MRRSFLYFSVLILTLVILSCTKTKPNSNTGTTAIDTASIIGSWSWASQSGPIWDSATLTALSTGITRTLLFDSSGKVTFIHNDSIFQQDYLQVAVPVQLLPIMETDTGTYQVSTGIVGCSITDTTTLTILNTTYQVGLSADTLLVHLDPCLSRVVDIYVRKN